jgi:hypothetical protein
MGEKGKAYKLLVEKLERKRPLERPIYRWLHNIKMNLVQIGTGGMG